MASRTSNFEHTGRRMELSGPRPLRGVDVDSSKSTIWSTKVYIVQDVQGSKPALGSSVWGSDGEPLHVSPGPDSDFHITSSLFPTVVGAAPHSYLLQTHPRQRLPACGTDRTTY